MNHRDLLDLHVQHGLLGETVDGIHMITNNKMDLMKVMTTSMETVSQCIITEKHKN